MRLDKHHTSQSWHCFRILVLPVLGLQINSGLVGDTGNKVGWIVPKQGPELDLLIGISRILR